MYVEREGGSFKLRRAFSIPPGGARNGRGHRLHGPVVARMRRGHQGGRRHVVVAACIVDRSVVEREAVVARHEVDALLRLRAARDRRCLGSPAARDATPRHTASGESPSKEAARIVAEAAVPFQPAYRRRSCRPDRDPRHPRLQRSASCRPAADADSMSQSTGRSRQGIPTFSSRDRIDARSKRKPSTCISVDPVAGGCRGIRAAHDRLIGIQRVAAAGVVQECPGLVRREDVVDVVRRDPRVAQRGTVGPAFRRVVEHDVEDHRFEARPTVQRLKTKSTELVDGAQQRSVRELNAA